MNGLEVMEKALSPRGGFPYSGGARLKAKKTFSKEYLFGAPVKKQ